MPCILNIETSTRACSLALSLDGELVFNRIEGQANSHASLIGTYGWEAMEYVRNNNLKVNGVAISAGPGSYTGLRIGISEAKGLCYGLNVPLIAISSLKILVSELFRLGFSSDEQESDRWYCPMIDARRMEVYAALYDKDLKEIRTVQADIIEENSYAGYLAEHPVVFFGDGSGKCKDIIKSSQALFVDDIYPTAEAMIPLAEKAYSENEFVDIAYFEPFYLKEFQATVAKNKVININSEKQC